MPVIHAHGPAKSTGSAGRQECASVQALLASTCSCQLQALTAYAWGTVVHRHGTKPLLIFSHTGSVAMSLALAFAPSLQFAIAARFMAGLMNSANGSIKTNVAQSYHPEHQVRVPVVITKNDLVVESM